MKSIIVTIFTRFFNYAAVISILTAAACSQPTLASSTSVTGSSIITITFADLQPNHGIDYQKLADEFHHKNPTITVSVIPVDHSVQLAEVDIARQADVILLNGENPAALPGFTPLQPLLDAASDFKASDLWPGSMAACSDAQGNPYGVPLTLSLQGIYFNPAILDRYQVAYPQPGWTWKQFQQLVSQLGQTAGQTTLYGFVDGPDGSLLDPLLGQAMVSNGGKVDAQAMAAGIGWYQELAKEQKLFPKLPAVNGLNYQDPITMILNNDRAAMWLSSTTTYTTATGNQRVYLPYPVEQPTDHTTPVFAGCGAVSAGSKNPKAGWDWLDFLSQHDLSGDQKSGILPARRSLAGLSPYFDSLNEKMRSALQYGLEHAWYYPPGLGNTLYTVEQAIANAIQSGTDMVSAVQGIANSLTAFSQATATPTAQPVNTPQAMPTNLPAEITLIKFDEATVITTDPTKTYNGPELKALMAEFNKTHPDLKVTFGPDFNWPVDGNGFRVLAQNDDCFEFASPQMFYQTLLGDDLLDLSPFLDASPTLRDDFFPVYLTPFQKDGKQYGLPAGVDVYFIAYNADLLTKLGIPFPKTGWTFQDFLTLAAQAANPSAANPVYGFGNDVNWVLRNQGVQFYDASVQPPKAVFNTDAMTKTFTWFQQLIQSKTLYTTNNVEYANFMKAVQNGQVAFWSTDGFRNYNQNPANMNAQPIFDNDLPFKVGYVPFPILASGLPASSDLSMVGYYISAHTAQAKADACWTWIQYLSDHPTVFGGYSPRQSVLPEESVGQDPARFAVVQTAIQQYNGEAYTDSSDPLLWPYDTEFVWAQVHVAEGLDAATALAEAQRQSDVYYACISEKNLKGMSSVQLFQLVQSCYVPPQVTPQP